jgi:hypothetical protein
MGFYLEALADTYTGKSSPATAEVPSEYIEAWGLREINIRNFLKASYTMALLQVSRRLSPEG